MCNIPENPVKHKKKSPVSGRNRWCGKMNWIHFLRICVSGLAQIGPFLVQNRQKRQFSVRANRTPRSYLAFRAVAPCFAALP